MTVMPPGFQKTAADSGECGGRLFDVRKLTSLYGFGDHPDFNRAVPFLAALVLLFVIAVAAACEANFGKLHWGTYRSTYFLYLGLLALAAGVLGFLPRLAWLLIALSFVDFSLGMSTSVASHQGYLKRSMLPIDNTKHQFSYHPLLQARPTPNYFGVKPSAGQSGLAQPARVEIHHDSYGLRGIERDKDRLKQQIVIAAVGGSTTYDLGVTDGRTWPDVLERELGNEYAVLNYGVPGYTTAEHLIQTLFYLEPYGITPRCAVYYIGWNDVANAHLPKLDPGYADYHLVNQLSVLQVRGRPLLAEISPLAAIVGSYLQVWIDSVPQGANLFGHPPVPGSDSRLEKIFRRNVEALVSINDQRGIKTIFVGQVLNRAQLRGGNTDLWWPLVRDVDLWPLQARFNGILKETADALGSPVLVPPIDEFRDTDFLDEGHFSAPGSEKFATMLAPFVRANCIKR